MFARLILGMVCMLNTCEEMERFCSVSCYIGNEHIEMRSSQTYLDSAEVEKLKNLFILRISFLISGK